MEPIEDKSSFLACLCSKICYLDGRVYHRNMKNKLDGSIWGREQVITAIHDFLRRNEVSDDVIMSDS